MNNMITFNALCSLLNSRAVVVHNSLSLQGRWAVSLFRCSFGRYQNLLRMILIDCASLVTAPKDAPPQELN